MADITDTSEIFKNLYHIFNQNLYVILLLIMFNNKQKISECCNIGKDPLAFNQRNIGKNAADMYDDRPSEDAGRFVGGLLSSAWKRPGEHGTGYKLLWLCTCNLSQSTGDSSKLS